MCSVNKPQTRITVFTPTYNRACLLKRLYSSLLEQNIYNFEWIIVDDDSEDDTEQIVREFIKTSSPFEISYYKQAHGGKHRAINLALKYAKGEYFFIVDSDDYLTGDAMIYINSWIDQLSEQENIAGVSGLCAYNDGRVIGNYKYNKKGYVEASNLERYKMMLDGDKAEVYKTKILKKYQFPEFDNEYFLTERFVWDVVAADGFKLRWYDKVIYIAEYRDDGLTKSGSNELRGHVNNFVGYCHYQCHLVKIFSNESIAFQWQ